MIFWVFCPIIPRRFPLLLSWVTVEVYPPPDAVPAPTVVSPAEAGITTVGSEDDSGEGGKDTSYKTLYTNPNHG